MSTTRNADGTIALAIEKVIDREGSIRLLPVVRVRVVRISIGLGGSAATLSLPQPIVIDPINGLSAGVAVVEKARVLLRVDVDKIMEGGGEEHLPRVAKDDAEKEALGRHPGQISHICCAVDATDKFRCTRQMGHDGDHVATAKLVIARWERPASAT